MEQFLTTETLVIELLLIASLVAIVVKRLNIPYTVLLVLVGLIITSQQTLKIELTSELILGLFVPPLVFEAAFHLEFTRLRENLLTILVLAVPGVLVTTLIVALLVSYGANIAFPAALVFGALISATDPVAVVALFRSLGTPKKLLVMVEGESLFNDGTAIVVFNLVLAIALPVAAISDGHSTKASFDLIVAIIDFVRVSAGGIGIGIGLGWVVSQLLARLDDYLIETTLTTVLAFGSYLVAEHFHVSGVLAVVGAGVVCGNLGTKAMSPTTRIVLFNFWEYLAFVVNSVVFLLIGLDVNLNRIGTQLGPIAIGILAVLISRALVVYGLCFIINFQKQRVSLHYQHVLMWGGLRGAVSLALVLSLPTSLVEKEVLQVMAYGVVLFTLLGQGTTINFLLQRLDLLKNISSSEQEYERRHGRLMATQAAKERIQQMYDNGLISGETWKLQETELNNQLAKQAKERHEFLSTQPALQDEELEDTQREGLKAQRVMLSNLYNNGVLSEAIYEELVKEVDAFLEMNSNKK